MATNQLPFFATEDDLLSLLQTVESIRQLRLVAGGLFDDVPDVEPRELAVVTSCCAKRETTYLVFAPGIHIAVRPVPQRRGGVKYAVDQLANPKTIAFRPGGSLARGCLVAGQLGTISEDPDSLELFQICSKQMRRVFTRIKAYYVGIEASKLLDQGWRLTANPKSPTLYDLTRD